MSWLRSFIAWWRRPIFIILRSDRERRFMRRAGAWERSSWAKLDRNSDAGAQRAVATHVNAARHKMLAAERALADSMSHSFMSGRQVREAGERLEKARQAYHESLDVWDHEGRRRD